MGLLLGIGLLWVAGFSVATAYSFPIGLALIVGAIVANYVMIQRDSPKL